MNLQNIDVGAKSLDAGANSIEDMLPRQANLIDHFSVISAQGCNRWLRARYNAKVAFAQDYNLRAGDVVLFESFPNDFFGTTIGVDVGLGCWTESTIHMVL